MKHSLPFWHNCAEFIENCPQEQLKWLSAKESLTARLRQITDSHIQIKILSAQWGLAHFEENELLNNISELVWIRETIHQYQQQTWVWARVLIPALTLEKTGLKADTSLPIGDILFQDPNLTRTELAIAQLPVAHQYHQCAAQYSAHSQADFWGRRSILWFHQHPILVIEVFLPEFFNSRDFSP